MIKLLNNYRLLLILFFITFGLLTPAFAEVDLTNVAIPPGSSMEGCATNNSCFSPYQTFINIGEKVLWTNNDSAAHSVTSGNYEKADGLFDSGLFSPHKTFSHTFKNSGTFEYFCWIHPWMIGSVVVSETESSESVKEFTEETNDYSMSKNIVPIMKDSSLVEEFVSGLNWPTTMSFIGNDILVLEKNTGLVRLVRDGVLVSEPVVNVNSALPPSHIEQGLLGIVTKNSLVYLYFTESDNLTGKPIGNRIYEYEWDGTVLKNPVLIKDLPTGPSTDHNGGIMIVDENDKVYAVIGEADRKGITQNIESGKLEDAGVIFPIDSSDEYYAIGIRNSFGLTIDHITGNFWDTENGNVTFDEINFVPQKFNSGWTKIQGPATQSQIDELPVFGEYKYSDPEFSWENPVGVTSISFINSDLFPAYKNSVLVGDFNTGLLYKFNLNNDRTSFVFNEHELTDLVGNIGDKMHEIIHGTGFGAITDIKVGPDGLIYVVSIKSGTIYRIIPGEQSITETLGRNCNEVLGPGVNLIGCDFSGLNLKNVDLSFSTLSSINFSNTNLEGAILSASELDNIDFSNANLKSSSFINSVSNNNNFKSADLTGTNMINAIFKHTNFENTILESVNLDGAYFENVNLKKSVLSKSLLHQIIFNNVNISDANLEMSDLKYAKITNTHFHNTNLKDTTLFYANLSGNDLSNADFRGADLFKANFSNSDLSGANFLGIYPYSVDFTNVKFSEETKTDSCLKNSKDLHVRALNKILREIRNNDLSFLKPIESLILRICT